MPAPTVRADYDQLKNIQSTFQKEAEDIDRMIQNLKSAYDPLRQNDWIGPGATAYFNEMESSVFPSLRRLKNALDQAAKTTKQISDAIRQAEQEASNCLNGSVLY